MKDKILMFVIGLLVGAIIATAICYIHEQKLLAEFEEQQTESENFGPGGMNGGTEKGNMQFQMKGNRSKYTNTTDEEMPELLDGEMPEFDDENRPELPDGEMPEFDDENRPTPPDGEFNPGNQKKMKSQENKNVLTSE